MEDKAQKFKAEMLAKMRRWSRGLDLAAREPRWVKVSDIKKEIDHAVRALTAAKGGPS